MITQAIEIYKEEFKRLPPLESKNLFAELTGGNPKKMIFISALDTEAKAGVFLDAWSHPIHPVQKANGFILRSAGRDGIFETQDDVVFERE